LREDARPAGRGSFYGRRTGRELRAAQAEALAAAPRLDLSAPAPEPLSALFPVPVEAARLEIGFGGGEHLIHEAEAAPRTGFIGVEPYRNGFAKAAAAIRRLGLSNIRLHDEDAALLLNWLPPASLERIDLLYPDPWPKTRHWKRRFVNAANLDRIARALKPGGAFRFASDWPDYVDWTLVEVARHGGLAWTAETADDWRKPFPGWPGTRYEAKALREGRCPAYLAFVKP